MADEGIHLTKPTKYNIEDSNIALLGSDLEKNVREHAGDKEPAWETAGQEIGIKIWRIEKFKIVEWPKSNYGSFYDGDSYIVLHTYKKKPEEEQLFYDLHFWIGEESSQDEAATAAYKTVELDDHLNGTPVEYREIQGFESPKFLSYFPRFTCQRGGVATGFHHVSSPPEDNTKRFYRIIASGTHLVVREVSPEGASLIPGDAYVLDMGHKIWQLNTKGSVGKERFKAAEFVKSLSDARQGSCDVTVYDEGGSGVGIFLSEVGLEAMPEHPASPKEAQPPKLYRLSDSSGEPVFEAIEPASHSSLSSSDVFILDDSSDSKAPALYAWIGKEASLKEKRLVWNYAQHFLRSKQQEGRTHARIGIVKMSEGHESDAFLRALNK